jgi:hypothetical protein
VDTVNTRIEDDVLNWKKYGSGVYPAIVINE